MFADYSPEFFRSFSNFLLLAAVAELGELFDRAFARGLGSAESWAGLMLRKLPSGQSICGLLVIQECWR
jgi:hypothetical protein